MKKDNKVKKESKSELCRQCQEYNKKRVLDQIVQILSLDESSFTAGAIDMESVGLILEMAVDRLLTIELEEIPKRTKEHLLKALKVASSNYITFADPDFYQLQSDFVPKTKRLIKKLRA